MRRLVNAEGLDVAPMLDTDATEAPPEDSQPV